MGIHQNPWMANRTDSSRHVRHSSMMGPTNLIDQINQHNPLGVMKAPLNLQRLEFLLDDACTVITRESLGKQSMLNYHAKMKRQEHLDDGLEELLCDFYETGPSFVLKQENILDTILRESASKKFSYSRDKISS
jgi:hypothetical protein